MSSESDKDAAADESEKRRRLRDKVFGDVLPETTADERDQASGDPERSGNDEWLRSNVPPHHG